MHQFAFTLVSVVSTVTFVAALILVFMFMYILALIFVTAFEIMSTFSVALVFYFY